MSEDNEESVLLFGRPGDLQTGGVAVCECECEDDAEFCSFVLDEAGIRNAPLRRAQKFDLRWPQILVAPDDVERAKEVLHHPVNPEVRKAFDQQKNIGNFPLPVCPHCGDADVLLEGTVPKNLWTCETCGARWSDEIAD